MPALRVETGRRHWRVAWGFLVQILSRGGHGSENDTFPKSLYVLPRQHQTQGPCSSVPPVTLSAWEAGETSDTFSWYHGGSEQASDLPKVTQRLLGISKAVLQLSDFNFQSHSLACSLCPHRPWRHWTPPPLLCVKRITRDTCW